MILKAGLFRFNKVQKKKQKENADDDLIVKKSTKSALL